MMKALLGTVLVATLSGCISTPDYLQSSAEEISGAMQTWRPGEHIAPPTVSIWKQKVWGSSYALFQLRTNPDIYRFALSRAQMEMFLDAINRYQAILQQTGKAADGAAKGLYRTEIRLMRSGESSWRDRLLVNVERRKAIPVLALTFDSWYLSFGRAELVGDKVYRQIEFEPDEVSSLKHLAEGILNSM